ncbi:MAG: DNA-3-methyladenine glycosylase I [Alphaproteobacteria bacterium]|nr:DNA-3-methyladenine glycosylase I [Alphaproteobacteria bacterium]MBU6473270.1 DNA-3-methyladenine glycosylase I [Alphaproteobacteria bacterium]MDE2013413.1 DNA-3-methyladenine glycosylase I [Alphaproteobacteria bacterium]MDE2073264.1 DNA-3-methyladenine glycosylase I [Alphaproteobacteria bacterium]MDE2351228.1 DNA-3-methyladenine glycosylase I [Alphaproteobacteria bacterium]
MSDGLVRCGWSEKEPIYIAYHDDEWGVPEYDDRALYEKLVLDGFQAGLSWITILKKRENFRKAFHGFDPQKIARYGKRDTERLLKNEGIIRSPTKIAAAVKGAQLWLDIMEKEPGGFRDLIWKHVDGSPRVNHYRTLKQVPAQTKMSEALAKELKQRGFNFCGPVIVYAFAQAIGMVNDHIVTCHRHAACAAMA